MQHSSVPVNPLLAGPAYLNGYIERLGTGTTDIISYCEAAGLRTPEFESDEDFRLIIWRKGEPQNEPQNKTLLRYRKEIETLIGNPSISRGELAKEMSISLATIKRDLSALREYYTIEWVGSPKTGQWKVEKKV